MADATRSDVDALYGDRALENSEADSLVSMANRMVDNNFGGVMRTLDEVEGNEKDAKTFLAAHVWQLAEGGEIQSESQTGASQSFNVPQGDIQQALTETRYGRMFKSIYLRDQASLGVELGRRR
jgi:hypothetical protein